MVAPPVLAELERTLAADTRIAHVHEIATLPLGPRVIMAAMTLSFNANMTARELRRSMRDITAALKAVDSRIAFVFVRPAEREQAVRRSA